VKGGLQDEKGNQSATVPGIREKTWCDPSGTKQGTGCVRRRVTIINSEKENPEVYMRGKPESLRLKGG